MLVEPLIVKIRQKCYNVPRTHIHILHPLIMKNDTSRSFVLGVVAAVAVMVGSVSIVHTFTEAGLKAYSLGGAMHSGVRGYINPREHSAGAIKPSSRNELFDPLERDTEAMLRIQERVLERARQDAAEEALHGAAEEEEIVQDARTHFRAYRHCTLRGYTRSRLATCIDTVVTTGEYNDN